MSKQARLAKKERRYEARKNYAGFLEIYRAAGFQIGWYNGKERPFKVFGKDPETGFTFKEIYYPAEVM